MRKNRRGVKIVAGVLRMRVRKKWWRDEKWGVVVKREIEEEEGV